MVVRGSACEAASCTSRRCTPASSAAVYESMSESMRTDQFGDPGASGQAAHDPPGGMPVKTPPGAIEKDRTLWALADGQIDGPGGARRQRDGDDLAALAHDGQGPM